MSTHEAFSKGADKSSFAPKDSIKYSNKGFLGNALSSMASATYYTRLSICHPTIVHNLALNNKKKIIKSINQVEMGEKLKILLSDGILSSKVENKIKE